MWRVLRPRLRPSGSVGSELSRIAPFWMSVSLSLLWTVTLALKGLSAEKILPGLGGVAMVICNSEAALRGVFGGERR